MKIERLGNLKAALGECPIWHKNQLWMLDCRKGLLLSLDAGTGEHGIRCTVPPPIGSFAFNHDGRIVMALKEEIVAMDLASGQAWSLARLPDSHENLRLNDGCALPDGSFVVGTMHVYLEAGQAPLGGVYRLNPALALHKIERGLGVANGPCICPIDGRFHIADSTARKIWSYRLEADGSLDDSRLFVSTDDLGSGPDGCCFDTEGGLWTALVRAGAIARFDRQGHMTHHIAVPALHPSALCFGGADLQDLFVTSISDSGRLAASGPLDGGVFKVTGLGFRGQPRPPCRLSLPAL
jgi:sugar lactone lactonase YvrE